VSLHAAVDHFLQRFYTVAGGENTVQQGGDLFCCFSSVGRWSKWHSWGIMRHHDDDPHQSLKFMAIIRWARKCGQAVVIPGEE